MSIGGIQTYITNLISVFQEIGYDVCIYQKSDSVFEKEINGAKIIGTPFQCKHLKMLRGLCDLAMSRGDKANDIIVFACDTTIQDCEGFNSIAIQHGITWDKPANIPHTKWAYLRYYFKMRYYAWHQIKRIEKVKKVVCVDYNFNNWYRAEVPYVNIKTEVIPNFCAIPETRLTKAHDRINIIFARRFFTYRGTQIFADAVKRILDKYDNVYVTVAGEGPDEQYMRNTLGSYNHVEFIKFQSQDSSKIHTDKHIAIVPTIGSEGTSLSLLEAMASGCAPIATNVGGMTNIILDHYNGLLINPDKEELYEAMDFLISNKKVLNELSDKAFETARCSFSHSAWKERWKKIISVPV